MNLYSLAGSAIAVMHRLRFCLDSALVGAPAPAMVGLLLAGELRAFADALVAAAGRFRP